MPQHSFRGGEANERSRRCTPALLDSRDRWTEHELSVGGHDDRSVGSYGEIELRPVHRSHRSLPKRMKLVKEDLLVGCEAAQDRNSLRTQMYDNSEGALAIGG